MPGTRVVWRLLAANGNAQVYASPDANVGRLFTGARSKVVSQVNPGQFAGSSESRTLVELNLAYVNLGMLMFLQYDS